ncbi:MAG: HlyC/CorC family transporter [Ruminococcus sp.]|nr:HlyC/CorC family transporter [Ruminococcus sp.]
MDDRPWLGVIILAALTLLTCFLTACENSIIELKDSEAEKLFSRGRRGGILKRLLSEPNRLVMSGLILRSLLLMAVSAAAAVYFYRPLRSALGDSLVMKLLAMLIVICGSALVVCALGIVLPKRLCAAGRLGSRFALNCSVLYLIALRMIYPLELAVSLISWVILKLAGVKRSDLEETVTEEEILMMVDAVNETGGIEEAQAEMISNIFEFDDLEVHEIMTHRTDVTALPQDISVREAADKVIKEGFSRLPVYDGTIDRITGAVFAKDLLKAYYEGDDPESSIKELIREIKYIPENCRCDDLLESFTAKKTQIAVVVDEYGGTAGIVTMEDLLEAIVGSIQDEYDDETPEIQEITPNTFDFSGRADLDEALEALGAKPPEDCPHDTIGGFVTELLGHIPEQGERESVRWNDIEFTVISAEANAIEKLRAVIDRKDEE